MASSIPLPVIPIHEEDKALFKSINAFVHEYMSKPGHDNSHDYHHILRVLSNANRLLEAEQRGNTDHAYDTSAIFLAALLHDVGDHKYTKPGEDPESQISNIMLEHGAPEELAIKVQTIVKHVGYSNEAKNPQSVVDVLAKFPELAIVQDADRLDAIGAVGAGRCFAYGGAKCQGQPMSVAIDHFAEKLYKLSGMMKTAAGKEAAISRNRILEDFANQFKEESRLSFVLNE
ncbi:hypothetical protein K505DRAFT_407988 [Melanomma pulvis-pyrius CBS 109.77]|uniref:HD/PDEase domain-containing protein n=1 Tax=Melanomma pulvis-pyrius CBS 109.77 TaxID=1314802 RepID=A0A6A6XBI2_9PLEO|nr:hypothetical protein K505DRAFT_407988 [Melanomma pulvis-pyrius CBS 109.77]